ncbi:MAG: sulfotransferase family protein, partial [Gaiellaceae bacterium]
MEQRLVFVGGLHRSGTSLLTRCLMQHPLVSGFEGTGVPEDEGQHLQTVYRPAKDFGGPGRFAFDPDVRLAEDSPLVTDESRRRLMEEWGRWWDTTKPVLVEKSPPNLVRGRFLQALFPGARLVMMQRHPLAVAYATQKWSRTSLRSLVRHWLAAHEAFEEDRPRLE